MSCTKPSTAALFQRALHWLVRPRALKLWLLMHIIVAAYLLADWIGAVWGATSGKDAKLLVALGLGIYNLVQQRRSNTRS